MPTSRPRRSGVVICAAPRSDGACSVVQVDLKSKQIVFSNGEETCTPYERLLDLAAWLCQEQAPVTYRSLETKDGPELIDLRQIQPAATGSMTTSGSEGVF